MINESDAGYGQGSYNLTEKLRFTAGLRYTHDHKEVDRRNLAYPSGVLNEPQAIARRPAPDDVSPARGLRLSVDAGNS